MEVDPSSRPNPISPESYAAVVGVLKALLSERSEPLTTEDDENGEQFIGTMREFAVDREGYSVQGVAALYDEAQRDDMANRIKSQGLDVDRPIGHIELSTSAPEASYIGVLYLEETGQIKGFVDCSVELDEELSFGSLKSCYPSLVELGLEQVWIDYLHEADKRDRTGRDRQILPIELDDRKARKLTNFLSGLQEQAA